MFRQLQSGSLGHLAGDWCNSCKFQALLLQCSLTVLSAMVSNPINSITFFLAMFSCVWFSVELGLIFDFANARSSAYGDVIMMMSDIMPPWLPLPKRHTRQNSFQLHLLLLTACHGAKLHFFVQYCNLQLTPNITGSKVFTPCSSVKPIEAWNAVNNVLFANFDFHHLCYPITRWEM